MDDNSTVSGSDYKFRQSNFDRDYERAWTDAPVEFKREAAMLGLHCDVPEQEGMAMEFRDTHRSSAYTPDMANTLDKIKDRIKEKYPPAYHPLIDEIASALEAPREEERQRDRSNIINRTACYLALDEKGNLRARVHALLHSIPRLAAENGFPSMRASAKACGVSPEWLRKKRDIWCDILEIERPSTGIKSQIARIKYRQNALNNHWRKQTYKSNGNGNGTNGINGHNGCSGH